MRSPTETLIAATRILSRDIKSTDGVANAALREVADRLAELDDALAADRLHMKGMVDAGDLQEAELKLAELLNAAEAALYLIGNDADRESIGAKPFSFASQVPGMLRAAIAKAKVADSRPTERNER